MKEYTDWLGETYDDEDLKLFPEREATQAEALRQLRLIDRKYRHSIFAHLGGRAKRKKARRGLRADEVARARTHKAAKDPPKAFPADQVQRLLDDGFTRDPKATPLSRRYYLRDRMIAWLQIFGGLRASEPFHIWITDVGIHDEDSTKAVVRVYHPVDGLVPSGLHKGMRRDAVLRDQFRMVNRLTTPVPILRAGWKDPMLDDEKQGYLTVRWLSAQAGREFLTMYTAYLEERKQNIVRAERKIGVDRRYRGEHPFLFVDQNGNPYAYRRWGERGGALARAVARIGMEEYSRDAENTTHSLRHFYGQVVSVALPGPDNRGRRQRALHHMDPFAQDIYMQPSAHAVEQGVEGGWRVYRDRLAAEARQLSEGDVEAALLQGVTIHHPQFSHRSQ